MTIYFALNAIESILLGVYLILLGSTPQNQIFMNLSFSRLIVSLAVFILGIGFASFAVRSYILARKKSGLFNSILENQKRLWILFGCSIGLTGLMLFVLTRPLNAYGDFKLIYQQLEPLIVWVIVLSAQTSFFILVWYSAYFVVGGEKRSIQETKRELLPVFILFFAMVLIKMIFVTPTAYGPTGRGDEMTYFDMADSFYRGFFSVEQTHHYPPLYPLLFTPTLVFKGWAYAGIKLLNVIFSSSIVFPIFLISRTFLDSKRSWLAAFLSCLIPYHLVFPRRIVSENLYFPMLMWTMFVTYSYPEKKAFRLIWDILNGALIGLLYLTRYITLAAIPFFLAAWWVKPSAGDGPDRLFRPSKKKLLHFLILVVVMLVTFSPWLIGGLREGVPLRLLLGFGIASKTTAEQLTLANLLIWMMLYACYYILIAAPVFPLLILSVWTIDIKKWREGVGRWIFQVLLLMAGFYAAVTRHSWRAYYNRDLPSAIMGRYIIFFSVPFIITALITIKKIDMERIRSRFLYFLISFLIPIALVIFSYFALVEGAIVPVEGSLLKSQGSVDAFFIEVLGTYFFGWLVVLYGLTAYLLRTKRKKAAVCVLALGLIVYYAAGWPGYYQDLLDYQTYPWLANKIAELAPAPDPKSGEYEKISVFVPQDIETGQKAEIYNGLRVRGIDNTYIAKYSPDAVANMPTAKGFIIRPKTGDISYTESDQPIYSFNGKNFIIEITEQ